MLSAFATRRASRSTENGLSAQFAKPLTPPPPPTTASRGWSPSRPIERPSQRVESTPVANFTPVSERNTFHLTRDSCSASGIQAENAVVLSLSAGESLAFIGAYLLTVLRGCVSICGVTLSPSSTRHRVFAPRSSPVPVISWAPRGDLLESSDLPLPRDITADRDSAVVLVQSLTTGVEGLGHVCKVFENVFKPLRTLTGASLNIPGVHLVSLDSKDILPFYLPSSWTLALASVDAPVSPKEDIAIVPLCIVKGARKSGKSTFARSLVNRLLSRYHRVAFLECDLGQSEFTPGGMVALNIVENPIFGPAFTHPSLPYRAHYVGSTTPRTSPSYYLSAIQSLLETYKLEVNVPAIPDPPSHDDNRIDDVIPLVVNTMGWTKGLGADLNARIEELVGASHVFEIEVPEEQNWSISTPTPSNAIDDSLFLPGGDTVRMMLEAIPAEATNMHAYTAIDHRSINILSYFHAIFPFFSGETRSPPCQPNSFMPLKQLTAERWRTGLPICAHFPYQVVCGQLLNHVYLIGAGHEDVIPSELDYVLNGAIVGLICDLSTVEARVAAVRMDTDTSGPSALARLLQYNPGKALPSPSLSNCPGLALIRGVSTLPTDLLPLPRSTSTVYLHVLTPLPLNVLETRALVKGELELPVWGMLDFRDEEGGVAGVERGHVPYLQWGKGEGLGSEKRRVRRNLMRRAQV